MAKLTVTADDYGEHAPVTTDGTPVQAIRAFQKARGLDGMNLNYTLRDEAGTVIKVSHAQCAMMMDKEHQDNPREAIGHSFAVVDPVATPHEHAKAPAHASHATVTHPKK